MEEMGVVFAHMENTAIYMYEYYTTSLIYTEDEKDQT